MAGKDALKEQSKKDIYEAYSKLKTRSKNAQLTAKQEGESLMEDLITVGSGAGLGYYMGQRRAEAMLEADASGLLDEERSEFIAAGSQVAGIDLDLLVGGAATAAGIMKLGGNMSNTVRKIGIGALTAYAARMGADKGAEGVLEKSKEE